MLVQHRARRATIPGLLMGEAAGQVIPLGIAVAFSPLPIIAVVLMLATPAGRRKALAFAAGGLAAVTVIGAVAVAVLGAAGADARIGRGPEHVGERRAARARAAAAAVRAEPVARPPGRRRRARPSGVDASRRHAARRGAPPRMGVLLCGVNPKNLILILAAAARSRRRAASTADQAAALAVFVVLAMLGVALPIAASLLLGERADGVPRRPAHLDGAREHDDRRGDRRADRREAHRRRR